MKIKQAGYLLTGKVHVVIGRGPGAAARMPSHPQLASSPHRPPPGSGWKRPAQRAGPTGAANAAWGCHAAVPAVGSSPVHVLPQAFGTDAPWEGVRESPQPCLIKPSDLGGMHKPRICDLRLIGKACVLLCENRPIALDRGKGSFPFPLEKCRHTHASCSCIDKGLSSVQLSFPECRVSVGGLKPPLCVGAPLVPPSLDWSIEAFSPRISCFAYSN